MSDPGAWSRWGPPQEPEPRPSDVRLAPARVMQIIETGTRIFRRHWKGLIGGTAVFGTVGLLVSEVAALNLGDVANSIVTTDSFGSRVVGFTDAEVQRLLNAFLLTIGASVLTGACLTVAALLAAIYVDRDYRGTRTTLRAALGMALRRAPVALGAWLLSSLAALGVIAVTIALAFLAVRVLPAPDGGSGGLGVLIALIVGVGGFVAVATLALRWAVVMSVVALESVGPLQALRRAWFLSSDNAWRTLGLQLLVAIVIGLIAAVVSAVVSAVAGGPAADPSVRGVVVVVDVAVNLVTAPILPVMLTALYFDLRVRRDRLELTLAPQS